MPIEVVFETHAPSEDNERGIAIGWLSGRLGERGRVNAADMGRRRRGDGIVAVFTSDLRRAAGTAEIAFGDTDIPILYDWRLRECDFGTRNGSLAPRSKQGRLDHCDRPYPGGESHDQAIARVARFLADLQTRWPGDASW
jgi:broad specificity phosphatase PhoE